MNYQSNIADLLKLIEELGVTELERLDHGVEDLIRDYEDLHRELLEQALQLSNTCASLMRMEALILNIPSELPLEEWLKVITNYCIQKDMYFGDKDQYIVEYCRISAICKSLGL